MKSFKLGRYTFAIGRPDEGEQAYAGLPLARYNSRGIPAISDDLVDRKGTTEYRLMRHDPDVKAGLMIKSGGVLTKGWELSPVDDTPEAKEQVDFVQAVFDGMPGSLDDILEDILYDSLVYGTSVAEKVWTISRDSRFTYQAIKVKDPASFLFVTDDYNNVTSIRQELPGFPVIDNLDPNKFVIHKYQAEHGNPYGTSDLRAAYKYWLGKTEVVKYMLAWMERFAIPPIHGKVPAGASKSQRDALFKILDRVQKATSIVTDDNQLIELIEAQATATEVFVRVLDWFSAQIVKSLLGATLTTSEGARVGSMALGKVHADVQAIFIRKLKRSIEELVDEQIIHQLIDYNFAAPLYPNFSIRLDDKDLTELSEVYYRLTQTGIVDPRETWIRDALGLPMREELPTVPTSPLEAAIAQELANGPSDQTTNIQP